MNTKEQRKRARRGHKTAGAQVTEAAFGNEVFLDKAAVADRLGVRPRTVGEWAKQGKIPAYRIGNYLRFKWAEIETYLRQTCRVSGGESGGQHA